MRIFLRYLYADWKKTKHLSIRMVHLIIPICVVGVFIAYYSYSPWNPISKLVAYFQVLSMGFPILISLFTTILVEQESMAGKFQVILTLENRRRAFLSKLILLVLLGGFSLILACGLFGMGYHYLLKQNIIDDSVYWTLAFVILGSNICLYIWHFFLAYRFNKGVSIGFGIIESLVSALLLTGMGEGIWMFIPCAWAGRFSSILIQRGTKAYPPSVISDIHTAIAVCIGFTVFSLIVFEVWSRHWDGARSND